MSRKVKEMIERDLKSAYAGTDSALVVDVSKLSGIQANTLRGKLRAKGIRLQVVPNRLAKRVLGSTAIGPVGGNLKGPCALLTGGASIIEVAKDLVELAKDYPQIVLKGGVVDGEPDYLTVEDVAKRRSRLEILGDVVAAAVAPGRKLAGCLGSPGGKLAGCVKAMIEKLEKGEAIARVA